MSQVLGTKVCEPHTHLDCPLEACMPNEYLPFLPAAGTFFKNAQQEQPEKLTTDRPSRPYHTGCSHRRR